MSGELVARLKRRALDFLDEALSAKNADLAAFFLEQAAQLYVKATLLELVGRETRGHGVRELLGLLARELESYGFGEAAGRILGFVDGRRRELVLLEEAYTASRYGEAEYSAKDVERLAATVKDLIKLLDEVAENVKLG
ncbi:HEPN domain-containing protein [Thermofilum pendens]|uniref:HEPN domain protein n=1 Tax=Thermofilum pendens (strain DSM 2475 / Hrk 5) TaxID=368408 RepID=A1RYW2_THEPD|nr:HEPN domain-containing protein [Thermofilum pendens]ABL78392.1 HEPN domain protein [Thermofilum pendens Hrk 5]